jgi:hypothetical protein
LAMARSLRAKRNQSPGLPTAGASGGIDSLPLAQNLTVDQTVIVFVLLEVLRGGYDDIERNARPLML